MRLVLPLVALMLLVGAVARAQTLNVEAAKQHYAAGKAYYDDKRWEDALREFNEAYRLSKRPALLFNIALCDERLLRYDDAVDALRTYLRLDPNAEGRADIERKIDDLDAARKSTRPGEAPPPLGGVRPGEAPAAAPAPTPSPAKTAPATAPEAGAAPGPQPARRRVATWIVGAAGVALLAAGAGLLVASHGDYQTLVDRCGPTRDQCPEGWEATRDRGQQMAWAGDGLLAAGGVAIVGAVVLYVVEGKPRTEPGQARHMRIAPLLSRSGAGLRATLEF